jgi:hypothetical protein
MKLLVGGDIGVDVMAWSSWAPGANMMASPFESLELSQWHCSSGTIEDGRGVAREGKGARKGGPVGL